jgi:predicted permease
MVTAFDAMIADARASGRAFPRLRVWSRVLTDLAISGWHNQRGHSSIYRIPRQRTSMESRFQDIRFALRVMARQPLFAVVAIVTIAVGISATATIFSIANGLLLRAPTGIRGAAELVSVHRVGQDESSFHSFGLPAFRHLAAADNGLNAMAAYDTFAGSLIVDDAPYRVAGSIVSANYLDAVGARPALGRFFHAGEDVVAGRDMIAVISDQLWRDRFAGSPDVLGAELLLNGRTFTVVGVTEPGFIGHLAAFVNHVWVPLSAQGLIRGEEGRGEEEASIGLEVVARLDEGSSISLAQDALDRAGRAFHETRQQDWFGVEVLRYAPIIPIARQGLTLFLAAMFAVAGILLTITAVNVANMLLSRAAARAREVGMRLALGATRGRLVTQLLTESVMLFIAGGAFGTLLTVWIMGALGSITLPIPLPVDLHFAPDFRVLLFALTVAAVSGIIFGLSPALHATRGDLVSALKESGSQPRRRQRLRSLLVVTQVACSALLLVVAGLLIRSAGRVTAVDVGLDTTNVHAFSLDTRESNRTPEESAIFYRALMDEAGRLPGVEAIAAIDVPPLTGSNQQTTLILPDLPPEPEIGLRRVEFAQVSPTYLATMRVPLVAGREFSAADTSEAPVVVIVNEYLARTFWPGESAVGQRLGIRTAGDPIEIEVVGVMADTKIRTPGDQARPLVYGHWEQFSGSGYTIVARTARPEVAATIRDKIRELDPVMPPATPIQYAEFVGLSLLPVRIAMILATVFGAAGLLLAALGLYGLLAFSVAQRSAELGVRMALGAPHGSVQRLVVRDGLRLTAVGLAVGLLAAGGLSQLLRWMLFGLSPLDPLTYGSIALLMLAIATLACWLPARRAAATDPVNVLRAE